ncbi:MAG: FAD-dependent oxidoreductase, partial [Solirubrobacterales bacterium]|nr:FAD-dependent oxidoreductase [Solirubrobacterales bacterium]
MAAAKALRRAPVNVTVIDRTNHHLFQPLLYQMATGVLAEGDIAPPTRDIPRRHANTRVLLGDVGDVGLDAWEVTLETIGRSAGIAFDSLIVVAGAGQSYFAHDEFGLHAPGMKTIADALELRGRIFRAFELAELERAESERPAWLTIAVVGRARPASNSPVRSLRSRAGPSSATSAGLTRCRLASSCSTPPMRSRHPVQSRSGGARIVTSSVWESRSSWQPASPASIQTDLTSPGPTDRPDGSRPGPTCGPPAGGALDRAPACGDDTAHQFRYRDCDKT